MRAKRPWAAAVFSIDEGWYFLRRSAKVDDLLFEVRDLFLKSHLFFDALLARLVEDLHAADLRLQFFASL